MNLNAAIRSIAVLEVIANQTRDNATRLNSYNRVLVLAELFDIEPSDIIATVLDYITDADNAGVNVEDFEQTNEYLAGRIKAYSGKEIAV